ARVVLSWLSSLFAGRHLPDPPDLRDFESDYCVVVWFHRVRIDRRSREQDVGFRPEHFEVAWTDRRNLQPSVEGPVRRAQAHRGSLAETQPSDVLFTDHEA